MVKNLDDLFIFRADIFQTAIDLVEGKIIGFKQFRNHFLVGFGFGAWTDKPCVNKSRDQIEY